MILEILKTNFKDLLTLFVKKPWIGLVLLFMWGAGFFMNKWVAAKDDCDQRVDSITNIAFDRLLVIDELRKEAENERRRTDSLLREGLEKEIKRLKENVESK